MGMQVVLFGSLSFRLAFLPSFRQCFIFLAPPLLFNFLLLQFKLVFFFVLFVFSLVMITLRLDDGTDELRRCLLELLARFQAVFVVVVQILHRLSDSS